MKRRVMSFLCVVAMLISLFVMSGCSPKEEKPVDPPAQTEVQEPATEEKQEEIEEISYPERGIQILVGANPGGGSDNAGRIYAKYLEKELGQTITIVNINGGSGSLASNQLLDADADGYTMLCSHEAIIQNQMQGIVDYSYDAFDTAGVAVWTKSMSMVTNGNKFKTFDEMVKYAKENPGKVIATTELGGSANQALRAIEKALDIQFQIVDGGGTSDRVAAVAGGHADVSIFPMGNIKDYVQSGMFTVLGIFNDERLASYPDYPVLNEFGVDFLYEKFFGLYFPKGTDEQIVKKVSDALEKISKDPDFLEEAASFNLDVVYLNSEDFTAKMDETTALLTEYKEKYNY